MLLFPTIPAIDNYLIYAAIIFVFLAFLVISIRPKKKKEGVTFLFSDESDYNKVRKEVINEEYNRIQESKIEEVASINDEELVQLSIFHKNYPEEIKDIVKVKDILNQEQNEIIPIEIHIESARITEAPIDSVTVVSVNTDIPNEEEKQEIVEEIIEILEDKVEPMDEKEAWDELMKSPDDSKDINVRLNAMNIRELYVEARKASIKNYSRLKKVDLLKALKNYYSETKE